MWPIITCCYWLLLPITYSVLGAESSSNIAWIYQLWITQIALENWKQWHSHQYIRYGCNWQLLVHWFWCLQAIWTTYQLLSPLPCQWRLFINTCWAIFSYSCSVWSGWDIGYWLVSHKWELRWFRKYHISFEYSFESHGNW